MFFHLGLGYFIFYFILLYFVKTYLLKFEFLYQKLLAIAIANIFILF